MRLIGIIPARYGSTRFPGKPLAGILGKTLVQRVWEQASKARALHRVLVATDDRRIEEHVQHFGGIAVMTSPAHRSGTDRCREAAEKAGLKANDIVINIQGDEPFIHPSQIDLVARSFRNPAVRISTLIRKIENLEELYNADIPKVVINRRGEALYFSRQVIPYSRAAAGKSSLGPHTYFRHIGIYGYRYGVLRRITALRPTALEKAESLEQLRWMENGFPIHTALTKREIWPVDRPEDLLKILRRWEQV